MSTTNTAYDICPVGTAVFFPWMTEPPNSDWVLCNGDEYPVGTYPRMDRIRASQPTNCRVDKPVYSNNANTAESDEIVLSVNRTGSTYSAHSVLQPNDPNGDKDCWYGGDWLHITWKKGVIGQITGIELTARDTGEAYRMFPTKIRLTGLHEGNSWPLADNVSLVDPGAAGTVYVPCEPSTMPASELHMEIIEPISICLGRLRVFAKRDDVLITPKITRKLSKQAGVWCLRVTG